MFPLHRSPRDAAIHSLNSSLLEGRRRPIVVAKSAGLRFRLAAKTAPASLLLLSQSGPPRWGRFGSPSLGHGAASPTKAPLSRVPYSLKCSGRQSRPSAKVLSCGQNACTRHSARPIVVAKSACLRFRLTAKTAPAPLLLLSPPDPLPLGSGGEPLYWDPEGGRTAPWQKEIPAKRRGFLKGVNYSSMSITTPEPTVRPPSRMAKRRPFSMAMGVISSTFMSTLSPGMHISVPSGREMMPVTSVVRK